MREIPPTAGLPLRWRDLLPSGSSLQRELASFINIPALQITCSGTAAQIVTLEALKQSSQRHKVIIPAYTCPLVALAVMHCGLTPVLCDLAPGHFDLDHAQLAALADEQTLAIIATHLGGRVAALDSVLAIADQHGIAVIEDAAQSLGARWQGQAVGMLGTAGFYSLAVGKGLTLYEGGVLVSKDPLLRTKLQAVARQATPANLGWELRRSLALLAYAALYRPALLPLAYGWPLRRALRRGQLIEAVGDDFSADIPLHSVSKWRQHVGSNALTRLPAFIATLRQQAEQRLQMLNKLPGIRVMQDPAQGQGVWPFFMVLLPSRERRDAVLSKLWGSGLGVSRLYIHALPDYPYLAPYLGAANCPNARDFAARMLTISNSHWLESQDFAQICEAL